MNVVPWGGFRRGSYREYSVLEHIFQASPGAPKHDPIKQKELFKDAIEMFHQIPKTLTNKYPHTLWNPPSSHQQILDHCTKESKFSSNTQKLIYAWVLLFSNILEDSTLTGKLRKTLKSIVYSEDSLGRDVITNLQEIITNIIKKRRRKITGQEFRHDT